MAKLGFSHGAPIAALSNVLGGAAIMAGAETDQTWLIWIGLAFVALGSLHLLWAFTINGRQWWKRKKRIARKTIAAPPQFNNPASASLPRHDDEHRGRAVTDSYDLSACRIDLLEASRHWPAPKDLPPRMLEFAESVPEDQRQEWLRSLAAKEEVTRLISGAMRSGELPIWIANENGTEQPVAPGALLEVDEATVASGCYRPPNDRGQLYGYPLFVKRDDWTEFVGRVQVSKNVPKRLRNKR